MPVQIYKNIAIPNNKAYYLNMGEMYNVPNFREEDEFFNESDTNAAKNSGLFLLAGLFTRKCLQKITNKMFSSYFSKNPNVNPQQITDIGLKMLQDKGLMKNPVEYAIQDGSGSVFKDGLKKLELVIENAGQNAHFDPVNKQIRVSKNTLLSLPHEIGHAVEEHSTTFFKYLQRFRGNYTLLALLLYGLGRNKSNQKSGKETFLGKVQNTLHKYNLLIPLLAFSPELITEYKASKIGIDYLKEIKAPKNILNAARKHYAIAFCTYLALPLFAVLDNLIIKKAFKD